MQTKKFFNTPQAAKNRIVNIRGPQPQRGWSWVGAEQTLKLRKENLKGGTGEGLTDMRVSFRLRQFGADGIKTGTL